MSKALEDIKTVMAVVSVLGAAAGVYYASTLNPMNNQFFIAAVFALIGVGVANFVLLVLYEAYRWLKRFNSDSEEVEAAQSGPFQPEPAN